MRKLLYSFVAICAGMAFATPAQAIVLAPGGAGAADIFAASDLGTQLAHISGSYTLTDFSNAIVGTGTYDAWVYKDAGPVGPAGAWTLDFVYKVHVDTGVVTSLSMTNFKPLLKLPVPMQIIDAGYILSDGNVPAVTARWTLDGSTVDFTDILGLGDPALGGGMLADSDRIVIKTYAPKFGPGGLNIQDGGNDRVPSFAPLVPEPSSLALALAAIAGLGGFGLSRRRLMRATA